MNCQSLFSGKYIYIYKKKKNIMNLSSAEILNQHAKCLELCHNNYWYVYYIIVFN